MVKSESIEFIEAGKPISGLVTKFGGQPVWLGAPQWPKSKATGNPMRFICQIAIDPEKFKPVAAQMAYLFMTDEDDYVDGTWEADGGENAVILQPGHRQVETEPLTQGPSLYRMVKKLFNKQLVPQPCEFLAKLNPMEDPDFAVAGEAYTSQLEGNKLGGTPLFIQHTEFPGPGRWRLLLQLDSGKTPFQVNFGDVGVGYLFLSEDGQIAKFLWQCS